MSCCGQKRAALVQGPATGRLEQPAPGPSVEITFTRNTAVLIRGPVTGRHYQFHEGADSRQVDPSDAAALVKTGYFQRSS
jgi:hypothetical protein